MTASECPDSKDYEAFYREFDSPLMRQVRREAYGEDIGQHSWVGAGELRTDVARLGLTSASRLLDLGCGPCGPLTFLLESVGCSGAGLERSAAALRAGRAHAATLGVDPRLEVREADLNAPLPFEPGSFDAAMSLDVVLHLRDRSRFYAEVARVLKPGGRFLVTDAGVVTGALSSEDVRRRSAHGPTHFVPAGWNEAQLEAAGFRVLEIEDRTGAVVANAHGRVEALRAHRAELDAVLGAAALDGELEYLETVVELARCGALSRIMILAER